MTHSLLFSQKRRFIIKLGKALHKFGTPAYRLEAHLGNVSRFLDLNSSFSVTPTELTFVLWEGDEQQEYNHIVRVNPGELDLGSLARTDELVDELILGERDLTQALERLDEISQKSQPYPNFIIFLAFGASSGSFAMIMHATWFDVFWSTIIGFVVWGFVYWAQFSRRIAETLEPLSAIVTATLVAFIATFTPQINVPIVILSGIIFLIPGLALTTGFAELSARHLVSGTARIMDAAMSLFKLYFGVVLGLALAELCWGTSPFIAGAAIPDWTAWSAVGILSISLLVTFKTRLKDTLWGVMSCFIAYACTIWAAGYLGYALGAFVGAFAVGVYSNLFARFMNAPSSLVSIPGLVVLVPGSKVYIGLNTLVSGEPIVLLDSIGSQAFLIIMSIVAGMIFSNVFINPRRSL